MKKDKRPRRPAGKDTPFVTALWRQQGYGQGGQPTKKFIRAVRDRSVKILANGTPQPITNTSLDGLAATEIVYLCLGVSANLEYNYLAGSGLYRKTAQPPYPAISENDVQTFARNIAQNGIPNTQLTYFNLYPNTAAPGFVLENQCFFIVKLIGPSGMQFWPGIPAIEMVQLTTGVDPSQYYTDLQHFGSDGQFYPKNAPSGGATCNLFYAAALYPCATYPTSARGNDYFDYCIQYQQANDTVFMTLDPCIKNQGTHPDQRWRRVHQDKK